MADVVAVPVGPPATLLALVGRDPGAGLEAALAQKGAFWLLVGTAYPSNAGMVIRTAEGSGAGLGGGACRRCERDQRQTTMMLTAAHTDAPGSAAHPSATCSREVSHPAMRSNR